MIKLKRHRNPGSDVSDYVNTSDISVHSYTFNIAILRAFHRCLLVKQLFVSVNLRPFLAAFGLLHVPCNSNVLAKPN